MARAKTRAREKTAGMPRLARSELDHQPPKYRRTFANAKRRTESCRGRCKEVREACRRERDPVFEEGSVEFVACAPGREWSGSLAPSMFSFESYPPSPESPLGRCEPPLESADSLSRVVLVVGPPLWSTWLAEARWE